MSTESYISEIKTYLEKFPVITKSFDDKMVFKSGEKKFEIIFDTTDNSQHVTNEQAAVAIGTLQKFPQKIAALVLSRLKLNKVVYARLCEVRRVKKEEANSFLNAYHLMNATSSGSNYGLFYKDQLVSIASFSKGRKMDRLPADKRSFELIRFCTLPGITVAGGLSKLLKFFIVEKNAGDVMTYVDKIFSDGNSFVKAGFKRINAKMPAVGDSGDPANSLLGSSETKGNSKLIFTGGK